MRQGGGVWIQRVSILDEYNSLMDDQGEYMRRGVIRRSDPPSEVIWNIAIPYWQHFELPRAVISGTLNPIKRH